MAQENFEVSHENTFTVLLPLALVACSCPVIPLPPGQQGETPTLTGTAANWIGSAKTIKLELLKPGSSNLEYLGGGLIDVVGTFSIVLPGTTAMSPYLTKSKAAYTSVNCPTLNINPSDVRGSFIVNIAVFDGTTKIGLISLQPSVLTTVGDTYAALLFSDKATEFNVVCKSATTTNHLHANVGLGWYYDINEMYAPNLRHEYVDVLPEGIKWTYSSL